MKIRDVLVIFINFQELLGVLVILKARLLRISRIEQGPSKVIREEFKEFQAFGKNTWSFRNIRNIQEFFFRIEFQQFKRNFRKFYQFFEGVSFLQNLSAVRNILKV
jgi:hypothetical protein